MKHLVPSACLLLLVACGGSSPTTPSVPAASISSSGRLEQNGCVIDSCSSFSFSVRNNGPGCAMATDLSGSVSIFNPDGVRVAQGDWELTLGSKSHGVFRPGEVLNAVGGSMPWIRTTPNTYQIKIEKQTNVSCS